MLYTVYIIHGTINTGWSEMTQQKKSMEFTLPSEQRKEVTWIGKLLVFSLVESIRRCIENS